MTETKMPALELDPRGRATRSKCPDGANSIAPRDGTPGRWRALADVACARPLRGALLAARWTTPRRRGRRR